MIYLLLFLFIMVFSVLELNRVGLDKTQLKWVYVITGAVLVIMAGIRLNTGYDYYQYESLYKDVNFSNYVEKTVELGFAFLIVTLRSVGLPFHLFLLIIAGIAVFTKFRYISLNSSLLFLSLLNYFSIGFLINEMGQIRHGLAIALALFAMNDIRENKGKPFILKVVAGTMLHASMIVLIPAWFIARTQKLNARIMLISILPLLLFVFIDIRQNVYQLLNFIPSVQIRAKLLFYIYSNEFGQNLGLNISFLLRLLIFGLMIFYAERGREKFTGYDQLLRLYYFGILLYLVFSSIAEFAIRSSTYFKSLELIILPFIVQLGEKRSEKNVILICVSAYCFYSLFKVLYPAEMESAFLPYQNILQEYIFE